MTFTATSISASAQKRSSSSARAAAAEGASRCETALMLAEKSATVRLNASISSSGNGPRRLASCNPTRSSRQARFGEVSIGCHCSSTMPSTWTGVAWLRSASSSGSSCSRATGSSARITATVSMRLEISALGATPASRSAGAGCRHLARLDGGYGRGLLLHGQRSQRGLAAIVRPEERIGRALAERLLGAAACAALLHDVVDGHEGHRARRPHRSSRAGGRSCGLFSRQLERRLDVDFDDA
jgi:hypothetical protein